MNMTQSQTMVTDPNDMVNLVREVRQPLYLYRHQSQGFLSMAANFVQDSQYAVFALLPPIYPEWLGSQEFLRTHGVRFAYVTGSMANGIATADMVIRMAKAHLLGFFGAAGLSLATIEENLIKIKTALQGTSLSWGANLIHMPNEPQCEAEVVEAYLRHEVHRIEASAFMQVTHNIVHYAAKGLIRDASGEIKRRNYVFAKISQPSIAEQFMSSPSQKILSDLVNSGKITADEALLAAQIPVAEDITVESDSGGHTDNRPLLPLFTRIKLLSLECMHRYQYARPIRVGAAGGISTPDAASAAFTQGADYVLTGSINQACIESGISEQARKMLATADVNDVIMAPAADMFELGVKLQILKKGTLFPGKASRLYEWYNQYPSLESLPENIIQKLEQDYFHTSIHEVWQQTQDFFSVREPKTLVKAEQNLKHKMALVFRWYLGKSSRWAIAGDRERIADYQIWCGPAMGAFNAWTKNTVLESLAQRQVVSVALNLLEGATLSQRVQQLRSSGVQLPWQLLQYTPKNLGNHS